MPEAREPLGSSHLVSLAEAAAAPGQPYPLLAALETVAGAVLGHRMLTVMRFDGAPMEVQRLHSSRPVEYPPGGRKAKRDSPWGQQVLLERRPFLGTDPEAIRWAFDDHDLILSLGLGSVINMPVEWDGRCLGTLNLLHETGWYRESDLPAARVLATTLLPVLLAPTT